MRWLALAGVLAACGDDNSQCGTNLAEALFIETALYGPDMTCPGGGYASFLGTSGPTDTSIRVDDYMVDYDHCHTLDGNLTFDGTVTFKGTWLGDTNAAYCDECTLTSDMLAVIGTADGCDKSYYDFCKVSYTIKGAAANVPQSYNGSICDITFP